MGNFAGAMMKLTKVLQQQSKLITQGSRNIQATPTLAATFAKVVPGTLFKNQIAKLLALVGLE